MPRKKSVNEMTDREIMEKAFSPRVVRELEREYDLRTPETDRESIETPPTEESR